MHGDITNCLAKFAYKGAYGRLGVGAKVDEGLPGERSIRVVAVVVEVFESFVHVVGGATHADLGDQRLLY